MFLTIWFDQFRRRGFDGTSSVEAPHSSIVQARIGFYKAGAESPTFINPGGSRLVFSVAGAGIARYRERRRHGVRSGWRSGQFIRAGLTSGTIVNEGGAVFGGHGARLSFHNRSSTGSATMIANGGLGPGSGAKILLDGVFGSISRIEVFGNGNLDISRHGAVKH